ncbi:hypothetical protein QDR33_08855 [Acinetobacter baumannii]|uniref:hypothetical protein n=1 Tax=Acinetobacter baumannii TaxID=470 RepID=UPI002448D712|nr:hypothetical protein [Acinetobacter baumannii]MDH2491670.1 hypothetical protein [Acinetobacter baumannii]
MKQEFNQKIILCIPGIWENHQALLHALLVNETGYIYAGSIIKSLTNEYYAEVEEYKNDPNVSEVFRSFSLGRFSESELKKIEQHNMVIYVVCDGGSIELAQQALLLGQALMKAGGLAIKVETSGLTHCQGDYLEFKADNLVDLYKAFVPNITGNDLLYACGMHQFGKPDGGINSKIKYASYILNSFLLYQLTENPSFSEKDTFTAEEGMETLVLELKESSDFFDHDSLYFNPLGTWMLNSSFSWKRLFKFS